MGITINTNISAVNACGTLKKTEKKSIGNLEKLASGSKINKAADDASGLAVSKKMRRQISSLSTIVPECQDGINLLNAADGYLEDIQNILIRMAELTEKSANGIFDDSTDRAALQKEMNQLGAEIDRIADTANFNGNELFSPQLVMLHQIEKTMVYTDIPQTVEGTQYFSSPAPFFVNLGDATRCPDTEDESQKLLGDTLKVLADALNGYMSAKSLAAPYMDKGKMYYNPAGDVIIDAPLPLKMSDDDIKAALGTPFYSVDTYPSHEIQTVVHPEIDVPGNWVEEEVIPDIVIPETITPGQYHPAEKGHYIFNTSTVSNAINNHAEPEKAYNLIKSTIDAYKSAHKSEGIGCLSNTVMYVKKGDYQAVVAPLSDSSKYPSSEWDIVKYTVTPDKEAYTSPPTVTPERIIPGRVIPAHWDPAPYHQDEWTEEKKINVKNKQSYTDHIDKAERIVREWDEAGFLPITLQIGETSAAADKLEIPLFDLHTDKLFKEVKQFIGYGTKEVEHEGTPPSFDFEALSGDMDNPTNGDAVIFDPGTPGYTTTETDFDNPIYHYDEAIRDNTDTSKYAKAVTLDISNQEFAMCNTDSAKEVIDYISSIRSSYGALTNRLESAVNSHENTILNITAAESRIKDTDMAKEFTDYTSQNILHQSTQAMLAQANSRPENVLQLLNLK